MLFRPFAMPALPRAPEGAPASAASPAEASAPELPEVNLLDPPAAEPPPVTGPDGKPQRPEDVPEAFWDAEKGAIRPEALMKSWRDLRKQISRGEHKPPAAADAYALPAVEGLPQDFLGTDDPLLHSIREAALKAGLTVPQFQAIARPFLAELAKRLQDNAEPPAPDPAALEAARQAEIAKLGPQGERVRRQVEAYLDGLTTRGVLTKEERNSLYAPNAAAVRAFHKLMELTGEKPIPVDALDAGQASQPDLQRMLREGYQKRDEQLIARARQGLDDLARKGLLRDPRLPA
jgi:hypothetical protein